MSQSILHKHVSRKYDLIAPIYDYIWRNYTRTTIEKALKMAGLEGGESILDIGCGTGALEVMLEKMHGGHDMFACDVSSISIDRAKNKISGDNSRVTFAVGDFLHIDVPDKQFDAVFSLSNLHYFKNPDEFFLKAHAVAKPGAALVLVDWCRDGLRSRFYQKFLSVVDRGFQKVYSLTEITELLARTGWIVEDQERFSVRGYWTMVAIRARKKAG